MPIPVAGREASVDAHIAALRPSEPFEPLPKSREARLHVRIVFVKGRQHADPPHPLWLLRARHERRRHHRAAEQRDELAASDESCHLIPQEGCGPR